MTINVLVVDDEEDFAQILAKRLEFRNFKVTCVFSGDSALDLIRKQDFDVVLLDVLMPGQSGLDTLREITAVNPLIHIIMLTGHARVDTAIQGMELGAYDYLIKPADIEELTEKIMLAHSHKTTQAEKMRQTTHSGSEEPRGLKKIFGSISDLFRRNRDSVDDAGDNNRDDDHNPTLSKDND
jgi:DNA-binding NtrC family response regulator